MQQGSMLGRAAAAQGNEAQGYHTWTQTQEISKLPLYAGYTVSLFRRYHYIVNQKDVTAGFIN